MGDRANEWRGCIGAMPWLETALARYTKKQMVDGTWVQCRLLGFSATVTHRAGSGSKGVGFDVVGFQAGTYDL